MPLVRTPVDPPRFPDEFSLGAAPGTQADPAEQAYTQAITAFFSRCAEDQAEDKRRDPESKTATVIARGRARASLVKALAGDADQAIAGSLALPVAQQRAAIAFGRYRQIVDQLARPLFTITCKIDDQTRLATDLRIEVMPAQSEDDPQPSDAQRQLFIAINATAAVLSGVHDRDVASPSRLQSGLFGGRSSSPPPAPPHSRTAAADRLHDEFVRKLEGVARVGLEGNRPALASLALTDLRDQFTGRVAGRIKNTYARSLGVACLLAAAACALMRIVIGYRWSLFSDPWWFTKENFFMLFVGAAIGTWLSFLVRRVSLSFDDLAIIESDLLDPSLRILFVLGLTTLVGLLFWTGAVQIAIGGLDSANFRTNGSISILIGAFCGLSERSLATAIAGRAASFVGGLTVKGDP